MDDISCTIRKGKGNVDYNNRRCKIKNPPKHLEGIPLNNVQLVRKSIDKAYADVFNDALERYNNKRKPCRQIKTSYYEHLFGCKPSNNIVIGDKDRKSYYENIVCLGDIKFSGLPKENDSPAVRAFKISNRKKINKILTEYYIGNPDEGIKPFTERNPNIIIFNYAIHNDQRGTVQVHYNYFPVAYKSHKIGLDTQNSFRKAMKEMGYGEEKGTDEVEGCLEKWHDSERLVLDKICERYGLKIKTKQPGRGFNYTIPELIELDRIKEETEKLQITKETLIRKNEEMEHQLKKTKRKNKKIKTETKKIIVEAEIEVDRIFSEVRTKEDKIISEARTKEDKIISESQTEADKIISEAQTEADIIKENARKDGLEDAKADFDVEKIRIIKLEQTRLLEEIQAHGNASIAYNNACKSLLKPLDEYAEQFISKIGMTERFNNYVNKCKQDAHNMVKKSDISLNRFEKVLETSNNGLADSRKDTQFSME